MPNAHMDTERSVCNVGLLLGTVPSKLGALHLEKARMTFLQGGANSGVTPLVLNSDLSYDIYAGDGAARWTRLTAC